MLDLNVYATGIQHIGIPTDDIEKTISFYLSLGFTLSLRTENKEVGEAVAFLSIGNLVIETYENHRAVMKSGAVDHIAIDVKNIDALFHEACENGMMPIEGEVKSLPFWENGVKFFTILGPNSEKIEFCEKL